MSLTSSLKGLPASVFNPVQPILNTASEVGREGSYENEHHILSPQVSKLQWLSLTWIKSLSLYKGFMKPDLNCPTFRFEFSSCHPALSLVPVMLASSLWVSMAVVNAFFFRYPHGSAVHFFQIFAQILWGFLEHLFINRSHLSPFPRILYRSSSLYFSLYHFRSICFTLKHHTHHVFIVCFPTLRYELWEGRYFGL